MVFATLAGRNAGTTLLGLAGIVSGMWHTWRLRIAMASRSWPSVPGRIGNAQLDPVIGRGAAGVLESQLDPDRAVAFISYTYKIGPRSFDGRRVRFGWGTDDQSAAEDYHFYHDNRDVTVYYDPDKPERSVLEPGPVPSLWIGLAASIGVFSFASWRVLLR